MIYLDNASTTYPKPGRVAAAMQAYLTQSGVSPGRGGYAAAVSAERMLADVRRRLTQLVRGDEPTRMIFAANGTDALNLAIHGVLRAGDHVVTTALEHNSVSRPLETLRRRGMITLTRVGFGADGVIDPGEIARAITPQTRLVALNHASNVTGAIQPAREVGAITARHDVLFLLDAAQTIGVIDIDISAWRVDLLAFPAHKELLGPPGVGALFVGPEVDIVPVRQGGTGGDSADPLQPPDWPSRLESGTPNTVGIAGLAAALHGLEPLKTLATVRACMAHFLDGVAEVPGIHRVGTAPVDRCVGTASVIIDGIGVEEAGAILDESFDIAVRAGLHCAPYAHRQYGTFPDGTIRVSPGPFTTPREIDAAVAAFRAIAEEVRN
ncbi:MAG TPA: aminotransferase class V-fold PLP-dependent enzyme [Phycisphaerae bacterium]|nr:aminotransferase class V-fold PLP-dependent enzyme [Phycisphaerales bacterium]HRX85207.1 aminotransferase class V-fold PLP-dependent enzyme [Phycisphaerae bacterium]